MSKPIEKRHAATPLDWPDVDPKGIDLGKDVLGLSPADRRALGLSAPRATDLEAPSLGGSEQALAEVLARGGAFGKPDPRRKR